MIKIDCFNLPIAKTILQYGQVHQNWETTSCATNLSLFQADDWESMLDAMGVARCNMATQNDWTPLALDLPKLSKTFEQQKMWVCVFKLVPPVGKWTPRRTGTRKFTRLFLKKIRKIVFQSNLHDLGFKMLIFRGTSMNNQFSWIFHSENMNNRYIHSFIIVNLFITNCWLHYSTNLIRSLLLPRCGSCGARLPLDDPVLVILPWKTCGKSREIRVFIIKRWRKKTHWVFDWFFWLPIFSRIVVGLRLDMREYPALRRITFPIVRVPATGSMIRAKMASIEQHSKECPASPTGAWMLGAWELWERSLVWAPKKDMIWYHGVPGIVHSKKWYT